MNHLGLDLGDKRVWIAYMIEWVSFPHSVVPRTTIIQTLKKLVKEKQVDSIIVGLPYDLYKKDLRQLEKTEKFIQKLKKTFLDKKIIGHDERFSSFEAESYAINWEKRDDIAAAIILDSYLQMKWKEKKEL